MQNGDTANSAFVARSPARRTHVVVLVASIIIALVGARSYAGGWNDGSRLASVESLVDYHTWEISKSIFVQPRRADAPYRDMIVAKTGTQDKIKIGDRWYSEKSPTPALAMAGIYQVIQWLSGLRAAEQPELFCYLMTLFSSGLAYVISVMCVLAMAARMGLPKRHQELVVGSFALATLALPYTRHVNSHILVLAATAGACSLVVRTDTERLGNAAALGAVSGLAYAIDQAAGLFVLTFGAALVMWRHRNFRWLAAYVAGAAPLVLLHQALNFHITGTLAPAGLNPEFFRWPSSPFDESSLTGVVRHKNVEEFVRYATTMLVGKPGFLGHNVPVLLAIVGLWQAWRARSQRDALVYCVSVCLGTWMLFAWTSNNYAGVSLSIRWFLPLLAPLYLMICILLVSQPDRWKDLALLSVMGAIMTAVFWQYGPWSWGMGTVYWKYQVITGVLLAGLLIRQFVAHRLRRVEI